MNKIALGTAQFGLNYGISNKDGQTDPSEVSKILNLGLSNGVRLLDTAPAYGNSEDVIGQQFTSSEFLISSKVSTKNPSEVLESVKTSLKKLNRTKLDYLLIHSEDLLITGEKHEYWRALISLKDSGLVGKIGVSSYSPQILFEITKKFNIDVVQIPVSIFDQDYLKDDFLLSLKNQGIEIHARSVFLQGLVFITPDNLHPFFEPVKQKVHEFHKIANELHLSPIELSLAFIINNKAIDFCVTGVTKMLELDEILCAASSTFPAKDLEYLNFDNKAFSKPFNWKL